MKLRSCGFRLGARPGDRPPESGWRGHDSAAAASLGAACADRALERADLARVRSAGDALLRRAGRRPASGRLGNRPAHRQQAPDRLRPRRRPRRDRAARTRRRRRERARPPHGVRHPRRSHRSVALEGRHRDRRRRQRRRRARGLAGAADLRVRRQQVGALVDRARGVPGQPRGVRPRAPLRHADVRLVRRASGRHGDSESAHAPHRDDRRVQRHRRNRQVADAEAQPAATTSSARSASARVASPPWAC